MISESRGDRSWAAINPVGAGFTPRSRAVPALVHITYLLGLSYRAWKPHPLTILRRLLLKAKNPTRGANICPPAPNQPYRDRLSLDGFRVIYPDPCERCFASRAGATRGPQRAGILKGWGNGPWAEHILLFGGIVLCNRHCGLMWPYVLLN